MSSRFAACLRVSPSPSTLAESSAILNHVKSHGRVNAFYKLRKPDQNDSVAIYFTVFQHEPPRLQVNFEVPVYHHLPSPYDQDPFNIRGLQDRKPLPHPKVFSCSFEQTGQETRWQDIIHKDNTFHGQFRVKKDDWLQEVLQETGAPGGIQRGLGQIDESAQITDEPDNSLEARRIKSFKEAGLRMDTLLTQAEGAESVSPQSDQSPHFGGRTAGKPRPKSSQQRV